MSRPSSSFIRSVSSLPLRGGDLQLPSRVGYTPVAVRAAVQRAETGTIAAVGQPLLLVCFHFDPSTGRYTLEILKVLRLAES